MQAGEICVKNAMTCLDRRGARIALGECGSGTLPHLLEMYAGFKPRPASQGLPPLKAEACRCWVEHLLDEGFNAVALREARVIGHAAVLPDLTKKDGEFLIFVHQNDRSQGIGTALTSLVLDIARRRGLAFVWLTVETVNFHAVRLYLKAGFYYCDTFDCERVMRIDL